MRRIRIFEENYYDDSYDGYKNYNTDWVEVSEEEYELLKRFYNLEELQDIQYYISEASKKQKAYEAYRKKQDEEAKARKAKAEKTARVRKEKLLAKLKEELESESNS